MIKKYFPWKLKKAYRRIRTYKETEKFLHSLKNKMNDADTRSICEYVKKYGITMYPYDFEDKYYHMRHKIYHSNDGYPYVKHNNKELYFPKEWSDYYTEMVYSNLLMEQDIKCPHHYSQEDRVPSKEDVIADIGSAEGMFSLDMVDICKKIYIFEADSSWIIPLTKTFSKYKDKVEIVQRYVSNRTCEEKKEICLDDYFENKEVSFIKADIEGAEYSMLEGGKRVLKEKVTKALICLYHSTADEKKIVDIMDEFGFKILINKGYMLLNEDILSGKRLETFEMRRGVGYFYK